MKVVRVFLVVCLVPLFAQSETPSQLADRAEQLIRSGDKASALDVLAQASQATPSTAESEDRIGFLFAVLQEKNQAAEHFRKSISLDSGYAAAHYHLGVVLWQTNDQEHGLTELEAAAKLAPGVFDYHYRLGSAYVQLGQIDKGVAEFKLAVALDGSKPAAWVDLAQALTTQHDLAGAVDAYGHAVNADPANDSLRDNYAYALIETRQADRGIGESQKVLAHNASDTSALMNIGYANLKKGEFDLAEQAYRQVVAIDPASPAAHYDLGIALKMKDQIEAAKKEYEEAIRLDSAMPEAHYSIGIADWQLGDFAGMVQEMRAAIAIRPDYAEAHYMLGIALKQSGDLEGAIPELKEAIRLDPTTPGPYNMLGQILRIKGDKQGSEDAFATGARLKREQDAQLANTLDQGMRGGFEPKPLAGAPR